MRTDSYPAQIIWGQIQLGVKMSLGVRKQHSSSDGRTLIMNVGPSNSRFCVSITLNGHDTYDISLQKGKKTVWERSDIYAEYLNEVLLRMESQNWG